MGICAWRVSNAGQVPSRTLLENTLDPYGAKQTQHLQMQAYSCCFSLSPSNCLHDFS
jgi:hypothetical protein